MASVDGLVDEVKAAIPALAQNVLGGFAGEAAKIAAEFVEKSRKDIESYAALLALGEIDAVQFESSVRGKVQVGKMRLLQIKGMMEAAVDEFMSGLTSTILTSALKLIPS